jgi:light-regulated signal transduction histidine kinase (bacteriophytochrome)
MKRTGTLVTGTEPVRPAIITEKYSENSDLMRLLSQLQIQRVELESQSEQLQETISSLVQFQDAQANLVKNLEKSEQFKQSVIDSLPANIAIIDQDGVIVMVNSPWESFSEEGHMPNQAGYLKC